MTPAKTKTLDADTIITALGSLNNDADLAAIRDACERATDVLKQRRRDELRAKMLALAADVGLSLDEIIGAPRKRSPKDVIKGKRQRNTKALFDPVINRRWAGVGRMPLGFDPKRAVASS